MNLNARTWLYFFFSLWLFLTQVVGWRAGTAFLQSFPAGSQAINLPCPPPPAVGSTGSWCRESEAIRDRNTTGCARKKMFFHLRAHVLWTHYAAFWNWNQNFFWDLILFWFFFLVVETTDAASLLWLNYVFRVSRSIDLVLLLLHGVHCKIICPTQLD